MRKYPLSIVVCWIVLVIGSGLAFAQGPDGNENGGESGEIECGYTAESTSGPYYVSGAPETDNLNFNDSPGQEMIISGTVLDGSTGEPIPGAQIEVWQTDANGRYWPQASGDASDFDEDELNFRGTVIADEDGAYEFTSVVPGAYSPRPRHIHYRISAEGYVPIFTQTYWAGDEAVSADRADPDVDDCRLLVFEETEDGAVTATFNIVLRPAPDAPARPSLP